VAARATERLAAGGGWRLAAGAGWRLAAAGGPRYGPFLARIQRVFRDPTKLHAYQRAVVEGAARNHSADYARFLDIALGSAVEVRYLLDLIGDLKIAPEAERTQCRDMSDHVVRTLKNLQRAVRAFKT
jgi:23S rRNA-intervening sequence protein